MVRLLSEQRTSLRLHPQTDLISLKEARVPGGALAMRPLNNQHVQQLAASDAAAWPDIKVTSCVEGCILIDGYHRQAAAILKGLESINATCIAYTSEEEVVEAAFRTNLSHGLKAGEQNRGDYAFWLHRLHPEIEQSEIATRVGLTQSGVSRAITRREAAMKRAQQQEPDHKERQQVIKQSCKKFTRTAMHFLEEVDTLSDEELLLLLAAIVKKREDKAKLARIGRLFSSAQPPSSTTGPLRLSQFARVTSDLEKS